MYIKISTVILVLIDLVFLLVCLGGTRFGMEAMGVIFILMGLGALHVLIGGPLLIHALLKEKWLFALGLCLATAILVGGYFFYVGFDRRQSTVSGALQERYQRASKEVTASVEKKTLQSRQWLEGQSDPVHAGLCQALNFPLDRVQLADALAKKPDFSTPCVIPYGRKALPLFVLPEAKEDLLKKNIRPPAGMQEAIRTAAAMMLRQGANPNVRDDSGDSLLHIAVQWRDTELVEILINNNICVFLENKKGMIPLRRGSMEKIYKIIYQAALDPQAVDRCNWLEAQPGEEISQNDRGNDALYTASKNLNLNRIVHALRRGVELKETFYKVYGTGPLHMLADKCRAEVPVVTELFLRFGADINGRDRDGTTPLLETMAGSKKCLDNALLFLAKGADPALADRRGMIPLHFLSTWPMEDVTELIDQLLAKGVDINTKDKKGRTPLVMTRRTFKKPVAYCRLLLDKGADPNLPDHDGYTLLHLEILAMGRQMTQRKSPAVSEEIINLLIQSGARVNTASNDGSTPLHMAGSVHKPSIVRLLLENGAGPDTVNKYGNTLLHNMTAPQNNTHRQESIEIVKILLKYGAATDRANNRGQTALDFAISYHKEEMAKLLLAAGAVRSPGGKQ